jgi:hypothetical protein
MRGPAPGTRMMQILHIRRTVRRDARQRVHGFQHTRLAPCLGACTEAHRELKARSNKLAVRDAHGQAVRLATHVTLRKPVQRQRRVAGRQVEREMTGMTRRLAESTRVSRRRCVRIVPYEVG